MDENKRDLLFWLIVVNGVLLSLLGVSYGMYEGFRRRRCEKAMWTLRAKEKLLKRII